MASLRRCVERHERRHTDDLEPVVVMFGPDRAVRERAVEVVPRRIVKPAEVHWHVGFAAWSQPVSCFA